jgi:hypothetical protein
VSFGPLTVYRTVMDGCLWSCEFEWDFTWAKKALSFPLRTTFPERRNFSIRCHRELGFNQETER